MINLVNDNLILMWDNDSGFEELVLMAKDRATKDEERYLYYRISKKEAERLADYINRRF